MLNKNDLKISFYRGKGPGGQHKNKVETAVRIVHVPTGIVVTEDGRRRQSNLKKAMAELNQRVKEYVDGLKAQARKQRRDKAIHDKTVIRTYDFSRGVVKDHRTGKTASLKQVLGKGKLELLQ